MKHKYSFRFLWCLALLWTSTTAPLHAQNASITWQRTVENYLDAIKMATAPDGSVGIIVTGTRPGRPTELTKLDPNGNVVWQRPILGTRVDVPSANPPFFNLDVQELYLIEGTRDGGFVVVFRQRVASSSSLLFSLTKFDSAGNQLWIEQIANRNTGDPSGYTFGSLIETSDGGFLIGGTYFAFRSPQQAMLYKTDANGKVLRMTSYLLSSNPFLQGVSSVNTLCERNGGYAFAGDYAPLVNGIPSSAVGYLILTDTQGQQLTSKTFSSELALTDIDFDPSDNSLIVTSINNQGRGVLKLNGTGDVQFRTIIPRRAGESIAYVAVAPNPQDGYLVADTDPVNDADFRLTRVSRDGSQQTSQTFGGKRPDYLQAFDLQPNGNLILAGVTQSTDGDLSARQSISPISSAPVAWVLSLTNSSTPTTPPSTTTTMPPTTTPPTGNLALTSPSYDCNTGQLTLNTTGSNGASVEYRIVGNRDWSASNVFTIPAHQRQGTTFTLDARLVGGATVSAPFTSACGTNPPTITPTPTPTDLSFAGIALNCGTGQITVNAAGGDGTALEYKIPGLADWQASSSFTVPTYQRNGTSFTVYLRQSGRETQGTFTVSCGNARVASSEITSQLNAVVLPNPVMGNDLTVEVTGATGQAIDFALSDLSGKVLTTQRAEAISDRHRQTLPAGNLSEGLYLLRVSTQTQSKTVKVLKQ